MQAKIGDVPISNGAFKFANTKRSDASNIAALFASLSMRNENGSRHAINTTSPRQQPVSSICQCSGRRWRLRLSAQ